MKTLTIFILYMAAGDSWDQNLNLQVRDGNCINYQKQAVSNARETRETVIAICERYSGDTMRTDRAIQMSGQQIPFPDIPMLHYKPGETKLCINDQMSEHCAAEFPELFK